MSGLQKIRCRKDAEVANRPAASAAEAGCGKIQVSYQGIASAIPQVLFCIRLSLQRYRKFCFVSGYRFSDTASSVLYQAIASAIPQVLFCIRLSLQRYRKFCFVSGYRFSDTASSVLYQAIASAIPQVLFCIRVSLQRYRKFFRIRRPFRGCPSVFAQPDGTKHRSSSPGGATQLSPALQRWEKRKK